MPLRPPHPRRFTCVMLALAVSIISTACATKVITIAADGGEGDGSSEAVARFPAPFCIDFTDATGAACMTCYDTAGTEIKRICVTPTVGQMCAVLEVPLQSRCLQCMDSTGMAVIRACLKCDPPQADCTICTWSDLPNDTCKICTSSGTGAVSDSCSQLRPELQ